MRTWIIMDVSYLANRAFFTTGGLSHGGESTGTIYGILRDVRTLTDRFESPHFVFAFDYGENLRKKQNPNYKANRKVLADSHTPEVAQGLRDMRAQIEQLRSQILPELGFKNVLYQDGYEADDVIASVVHNLGGSESAIIISADKDLYQLLGPDVCMYHPQNKTLFTEESFRDAYHVSPTLWPSVKAIMGDKSDNLMGVMGVGEGRALQYMRGKCGPEIATRIKEWVAGDEYKSNLQLIRLPFPGTKKFRPAPQPTLDLDKWESVMKRLGIESLNKPGDDIGDRRNYRRSLRQSIGGFFKHGRK